MGGDFLSKKCCTRRQSLTHVPYFESFAFCENNIQNIGSLLDPSNNKNTNTALPNQWGHHLLEAPADSRNQGMMNSAQQDNSASLLSIDDSQQLKQAITAANHGKKRDNGGIGGSNSRNSRVLLDDFGGKQFCSKIKYLL